MEPSEVQNLTLGDLANPNIDQASLAQLAQNRPDLWQGVLAHPNCYPDLAAWIRQRVPTDTGVMPTPVQTTYPAQTYPVQTEYPAQAYPAQAEYPAQAYPAQPQYAAQAYPAETGFPPQAALSARSLLSPGGLKRNWPPIAMGVSALLAILALFMPIASINIIFTSVSIGWFSDEVDTYGAAILVLILIVLAAAVLAVLKPKKWVWLGAGIAGALVGIGGMYNGFNIMSELNGELGRFGVTVSIGAGVVMLTVMSILIVASAAMMVLKAVRQQV